MLGLFSLNEVGVLGSRLEGPGIVEGSRNG